MIRITCPSCSTLLSLAGQEVACSRCGHLVIAPSVNAGAPFQVDPPAPGLIVVPTPELASAKAEPEPESEADSKVMTFVRWLTEKSIQGIPPLTSAESLAQEYLGDLRYADHGARIDSLINWETTKNATSGFVNGLGGIITMPVTIPAAMGASWVIQARMAAAIARISGFDLQDDRVRTFVILAVVGDAVKDIMKSVGVQIGKGLTKSLLSQIPGKVLIQINKMVGFRLITKAGSTGAVNLMRWIPIVGGVVGGTFDAVYCRIVGRTAKGMFYCPDGDKAEIATA